MTTPIQANTDFRPAALDAPSMRRPLSAQAELSLQNPFLRADERAGPEDIVGALRTPLDDPEFLSKIHGALVDLMGMSIQELLSLPKEQLNEIFETVLRMARELPESGAGRGLAILAVATFAQHLDWRSGGEALSAALEPRVINGFVELADALDASENGNVGSAGEPYVGFAEAQMPLGGESLGATLRLLIEQVESVDRSARDPATTRSSMRGLFSNLIAGAEQEKTDIMAQLQSGDLSEEGLMLLRTRLQDANNLISVLNEILKQENDVLEAIIRNFA